MRIPGNLVIRTHAPLRRGLALAAWALFTLVALGLVFELGRYKAGYDAIQASKQRAALQDQIDDLQAEQRQLRVQLAAAAEAQVAVTQERAEVARTIGELESQVSSQQRDLDFYRGLIAQPGVKLQSVEVKEFHIIQLAEAGHFELRFSLTRPTRADGLVSGAWTLRVDGERAGQAATLELPALSPGVTAELPFSFRFLSQIDQAVVVPADFKPERVTVEVRPGRRGVAPYLQTFVWIPKSN
jgi:hypothetical protein